MEDYRLNEKQKLYAVKYKIGEEVYFKHIYEIDVNSAKRLIIKGIIEGNPKSRSGKIYEILDVVELKGVS